MHTIVVISESLQSWNAVIITAWCSSWEAVPAELCSCSQITLALLKGYTSQWQGFGQTDFLTGMHWFNSATPKLCLKLLPRSLLHYSLYSEWHLSPTYGEEMNENDWAISDTDVCTDSFVENIANEQNY